jgi:hypothetical protein
MHNPAFVVDGQMEQKIIQNICPKQPVRLLNCNGKNVTYDAAAKHAATLIRLLKKYFPIIIIFDRENRKETPDIVARNLLDAINKHEIQKVEIIIGVPDCMVENWLLADISAINSYFEIKKPIRQSSFEGTKGKNKLRSLIGQNNYSETQDGPNIFSKCRIDIVSKNSPRFYSFFQNTQKINCAWRSSLNLNN